MAKLDQVNYKGTIAEIVPEIAPLFKTTETYAAGDQVIYEADWYTFKEAKEAGAWDATKVDGPFKVANEIVSLKEDLNYVCESNVCEKRNIPNGNIDSSGIITLTSESDQVHLECFRVTPGIAITAERISGSGGFAVYAFFNEDPVVGQSSYNDQRTIASSIVEVIVPDGCTWVCIRVANGTAYRITPSSKAEIVENDLASLSVSRFSFSEVNRYIKELYFANPSFDVTTIDRVRIFNGASNYYGAVFYNGASIVATVLLSDVYAKVAYSSEYNLYAVFDNLAEIDATYKDFYTTVNSNVKNVTLSPTIYAYIKSKDTDTINTRLGTVFSNTELYKYIKELCFANPSFDVTTIDRVRIFNGASNYYGAVFYNGASIVATVFLSDVYAKVAYSSEYNLYAVFDNLAEIDATYKDFNSTVSASTKNFELFPTIYAYIKTKIANEEMALITQPVPTKGQIIYAGDTKSNSGYIVNAVSYSDGVIIACRADGKVVRIGYTGTEETLFTISGTAPFDWRVCFMDSNENVYVSPHASLGSMNASDRGLYRLAKGGSSFTKVISLYNSNSTTPTEAENNDDTIWTMCEDDSGNLYAGVYAHTVRANPAIYKSTNGGTTWTYIYNFKTAGDTPNGLHIHSIIWSKWQKALYVIVGEVNTVFRSADGGATWDNLNVTLTVKGSAMLATPHGVLIGSDGAYNCEIDLLENDNKTHVNVFKGWANTVFAIRRSDVTGMLYAFTKIDSSVNSTSYFPPVEALSDESVISAWHSSVGDGIFNTWKAYYDSVIDIYPDDAIRPQHYAILVSRDGGRNWEVLHAFSTSSQAANGCWTTGYFNNGECLTGRIVNGQAIKPVVISEGKHKYVSGGCNLDGEIFARTNSSSTVTVVT